jgi:RNA polymerase sigma factor (sigma-70 family)
MPPAGGSILQHIFRLVPANAGQTDGELVQRFANQHERAAFAALLHRHCRLVWGVCRHILHHEQDAEDAFQATFLVLAHRAASIRKSESVASWLHGVAYRIAHRAKQMTIKRKNRDRRATAREPQSATADLAVRDLQAILDDELHRLPEKYRAPFVLCCLEGRSRKETAAELDLKEGTVSSRIAHARRLLQDRLTQRGVTLSAALTAGVLWKQSVSAALVQPTLKAALLVAAGANALQVVAPSVMALMNGGLKSLSTIKVKIATISMMAASLVAGYGLAVGYRAEKEPQQAKPEPQTVIVQPRVDLFGDELPPEAIARLGTNRFWCGPHGGGQLVYTVDGTKLLATTWDSVEIFDAVTGKLLSRIRPAGGSGIESMSLSPDGRLLAMGTHNQENDAASGIQIFDRGSGQLLRQCKSTGRQQYLGVQFSPNGELLASYSYPSKTVYLWDPATAQELRRWPINCEAWSCLSFSRDSKTLIVGDGRTIHFWNVGTGTESRRIENHPGLVSQLALSPDGKTLGSLPLKNEPKVGESHERDNKVYLWDTATGKNLGRLEVIVDGENKTNSPIRDDPWGIYHFDFAPDGKTLVTASDDKNLCIWDLTTRKVVRRWDTGAWVGCIAFAPGGRTFASHGFGTLRLWDPATGKELRDHPGHRQEGPQSLALSPDGRTLASASYDPHICLWDAATGREQHRLVAATNAVYAVQFSADGRTLITLGDDKRLLRLWDTASRKKQRELRVPFEGSLPLNAFSPDGKLCASAGALNPGGLPCNGPLFLWDLATGKKLHELSGSETWVGAIGFSADSRHLYSSGDKQIYVWNASTGKLLREFSAAARHFIFTGCLSLDSKWFACSSDGAVLIYDVATGNQVYRSSDFVLPRARETRVCLAFSPDARSLAIGDPEGKIHLLELASGKIRQLLASGHEGRISALVFSADSERLISGSEDTTALVWDLVGRLNDKGSSLQSADVETCWPDLLSEDPVRAHRAIRRLIAAPAKVVACISRHLQPVAAPDAEHVARLLVDLDSSAFVTRSDATKELTKLGELAEPAIRTALNNSPSPEARRRLEQLLANLEGFGASGERLRISRAVEALEHIATPEVRELLTKLSGGATGARLTREARSALERLAHR